MPAMRFGHHAIGGNTRLIAFFVCLSGLSFILAPRSPQSPFSSAMNLGHVSMREPPRRPRFSLHPTGSSGCPLTLWQFPVCLDLRYEPALPILQLVRWWLVNSQSPVECRNCCSFLCLCPSHPRSHPCSPPDTPYSSHLNVYLLLSSLLQLPRLQFDLVCSLAL